MMKTRAAVLRKAGTPWEITEVELDPPKANEVLIRMEAAGLCHSDEHIRAHGMARLPMVGGHEGAGVVLETGPGVTRVKAGDRVSCSYIPVCGKCRYCSTGRQNLCDAGKWAGVGCLQDETFRFHAGGEDLGGMCVVGSFAEYSVLSEWSCVKVEDYVPMELAALVSCGVTTGFCSATIAGDVRVGDTVVVFGTGGVGMNAVQGAAWAGASHVFAIDPNEWKQQQALEFGATHAFGDPVKAKETLIDLTRGQLADKVICTVGEMDNDVVKAAVDMTGKAGTIVITGVGYYDMVLPGGILIGYHRKMQGSLFGGANPLYDIPKILSLWHEGHIKLPELITRKYTLDEVNEGYQDLMDGKNIRGVIVHQH
ncbi:MAG TPA: NDMA-dependent alcohol dehydrogenase [Trebonia sp.]|jgi:S-(hydroxymethyl)glutathione dehydrogenase/alcohol dehydrogenase|nr:NDMA-dependent alcohol dehydrogenase [Trebonia sp.]